MKLAFWRRERKWYRLTGRNPGSMFTPRQQSQWREDPNDPYFGEFIRRVGLPYIPPDGLPPWYEQDMVPPHLTMEETVSWQRPPNEVVL